MSGAAATRAPRIERRGVRDESGLRYGLRLVRALTARDFKYRYRRTFLGPAWALLLPLLLTLVFTAIRKRVAIDVGSVPYPLFTFVGAQAWTLFATGVIAAGPSVVSNGGVVKKIALPLEVFPLSAIALSLLDYLIGMIVLVVLMAWYGVAPTIHVLWFVPILSLLFLFTFAVGLLVAAIGTFRKDVIFGMTFLLQVGMLASPVFYDLPVRSGFSWHFLNPVVGILSGLRDALLHGRAPAATPLLVATGVVLLLLLAALPAFRRAGRYFADVI